MKQQETGKKKLRGIFPAESKTDKDIANENSPAVFSSAGQFYAIASDGEMIRRFEIILGSGKKYSFPYALLPVCILEDSATIYIKAYELLITITGRNLDPIHEHFSNELILWIKASLSGKDDGSAPTFIEEITVEGKTVNESIKTHEE